MEQNLPPMPTPLPPLPTQYTSENENNLNEGYEMGVSPNKPEKPKRGHHSKSGTLHMLK